MTDHKKVATFLSYWIFSCSSLVIGEQELFLTAEPFGKMEQNDNIIHCSPPWGL
jgi:hypothetical protein